MFYLEKKNKQKQKSTQISFEEFAK